MKCRSCGFENMKNSESCARCGAKLVLFRPVRKKDFRPRRGNNGLLRRIKFYCGRLWERLFGSDSLLPFDILRRIPRENMRRIFASIVPGIGHMIAKKGTRAAGVFAGWALAIALTVLFAWLGRYNATIIGVAIAAALHAGAVIEAMQPAEFCRTKKEVRLLALLATAGVFIVYAFIAYLVFRDMTFTYHSFARHKYGWW